VTQVRINTYRRDGSEMVVAGVLKKKNHALKGLKDSAIP